MNEMSGKFLLTRRFRKFCSISKTSCLSDFIKYNFELSTMAESYRKAIGGNVWHFCENCNTWPVEGYIASQTPEQIGHEVLCNECVARHEIGDCENYTDANSAALTKCPVTVDAKECGRKIFPELMAGLHSCSAGHRILVVPATKFRK
jgi:hypothetical protein